jgi:hypothetical protein
MTEPEMTNLTPEGLRLVSDVANRQGFSVDAALALLNSLMQGNGYQAQFNHPELGGMGQWSQGGMIMIGDMFNNNLKYRVDALCNDLGNLIRSQPLLQPAQSFQSQSQNGGGVSLFVPGSGGGGSWWPSDLGSPGSTGAQNDLKYAYFPDARRLAIQQGGQVKVYDTGDHWISGFSQQQSGDQSLTFTSQNGLVRVADLPLVSPRAEPRQPPTTTYASTPEFLAQPAASPEYAPPPPPAAAAPSSATNDILTTIERLAELRQKNILTDEEFLAKKAELLSRI